MQVTFKYKSGQTRKMSRQEANILQHLGHGDIVLPEAEAPQGPASESTSNQPAALIPQAIDAINSDANNTDQAQPSPPAEPTLEQLKAEAAARGIKHHPQIGLKKLRALVEGSTA